MDRLFVSRGDWKMSSPLFVLAGALAAFTLFLGVRGLLYPMQAAHGFGLPLFDGDAHWLRIKAGRDLSIGLAITALLVLRMRPALAALLLAGGLIPLVDCIVSVASASGLVAYALAVHGSAAAFSFGLGAALLRPPRTRRPHVAQAERAAT